MTTTKYSAKYNAPGTEVTELGSSTTAKYNTKYNTSATEVTERNHATTKYNALATERYCFWNDRRNYHGWKLTEI